MREIKFRAWNGNAMYAPTCHEGETINEALADMGKNTVLMQYTGIKDKNGKEIYEGDLVEERGGKRGTIVFYGGCFCWENKDTTITELTKLNPASYYEVIGNIYETNS